MKSFIFLYLVIYVLYFVCFIDFALLCAVIFAFLAEYRTEKIWKYFPSVLVRNYPISWATESIDQIFTKQITEINIFLLARFGSQKWTIYVTRLMSLQILNVLLIWVFLQLLLLCYPLKFARKFIVLRIRISKIQVILVEKVGVLEM